MAATERPVGRSLPVKTTVVLGVCLTWLLVGLVWGAQTALGSTVRGTDPIPLARALNTALVQSLPWIPVTLAVIALTIRYPLARTTWPRHALLHAGRRHCWPLPPMSWSCWATGSPPVSSVG
ncbi:MAG: hypothetical protein ACRENP_21780 [Longimicrobiales bacterium]